MIEILEKLIKLTYDDKILWEENRPIYKKPETYGDFKTNASFKHPTFIQRLVLSFQLLCAEATQIVPEN